MSEWKWKNEDPSLWMSELCHKKKKNFWFWNSHLTFKFHCLCLLNAGVEWGECSLNLPIQNAMILNLKAVQVWNMLWTHFSWTLSERELFSLQIWEVHSLEKSEITLRFWTMGGPGGWPDLSMGVETAPAPLSTRSGSVSFKRPWVYYAYSLRP